jgi:hypothetical protein
VISTDPVYINLDKDQIDNKICYLQIIRSFHIKTFMQHDCRIY